MRLNRLPLVAGATVLFLALGSAPSRAAITITFQQVGADVLATGFGSAITTGLTVVSTGGFGAGIVPSTSVVLIGPTASTVTTVYSGVTGPSNFGPGGSTFGSSGTGQRFGLNFNGTALFLFLPDGYVSGSALAGSATYNNASLTSLGITPGTYVYSFGSGATADTLTIEAVDPASTAAPEPGSLALLLPIVGTVGMVIRKRKK